MVWPIENQSGKGRISKMAQETQLKDNSKNRHPIVGNQKVQSNLCETAQYIADMVLELRNMAKAVELLTLQGLLEVTFYEAFSAANQVVIPEGEIEKLRELSKASNG